eukprot:358356_1
MIPVIIDRVIIALFMITSYVFYISNTCNRTLANESKNHTETNNDSYHKWMNRWSMATLIVCLFRLIQIFLNTFPELCLYTNTLYIPIHVFILIFTSFYQIARLQTCFNSDYTHCFFLLLYINGILILIFIIFSENISYTIVPDDCALQLKVFNFQPVLFGVSFIWFYAWDLYIVYIYINNIRQLKKRLLNRNTNNNEILIKLKKINIYLRKVLILTIIIEITNAIYAMTVATINIELSIFDCLQVMVIFICMYLMIEHNNSKYVTIVKLLSKLKLCCCCTKFVYSTIPSNDNEVVTVDDKNMNVIVSNNTNTTDSQKQETQKTNTLNVIDPDGLHSSITEFRKEITVVNE